MYNSEKEEHEDKSETFVPVLEKVLYLWQGENLAMVMHLEYTRVCYYSYKESVYPYLIKRTMPFFPTFAFQ